MTEQEFDKKMRDLEDDIFDAFTKRPGADSNEIDPKQQPPQDEDGVVGDVLSTAQSTQDQQTYFEFCRKKFAPVIF